ncbi:MAG: nuclear transport factor 2 family protein [Pseudomonadota bacterium]
MKSLLPYLCAALLSSAPGFAQAAPDDLPPLQEIDALDQAIFEAAFLTCDADRLAHLLAPDLEFYHDVHGQIARSSDAFLSQTIPDCQARRRGELPYLRRDLVADSHQISPIGTWGALQSGRHVFVGRSEDGGERVLEEALFMHIWQYEGGAWRLTRVISYDHRSPPSP